MNRTTVFEDLGMIDYKKCWDYQESLFQGILSAKIKAYKNDNTHHHNPDNHLIFCEHPHVFTLGKSGSENNLLVNFLELNKIAASFYKINRGGDITYHGPGQIVAYPILDLEQFKMDIKTYVYSLEEAVIRTLLAYNIEAERLKGATGVWLDTNTPGKARKICAIGVKASRYVSMHGLAFNVNTDLNYFSYINPCGFTDKAVTSLKKELNKSVPIEEVKNKLKLHLSHIIGLTYKT